MIVATAAADIENLCFYQRLGFRMRSIERDAFTPERGYPAGTLVDGIELRDRVWLDQGLSGYRLGTKTLADLRLDATVPGEERS
jgi:hypothetical protein